MKYLPLFAFLAMSVACGKSNSSSGKPAAPPSLVGNWNIFKWVAADFSAVNGMPPLPNDTIYPIHSEHVDFTADSLNFDTWETFTYYETTKPDSFANSQNKEFGGTFAYTATSSYYVSHSGSTYDTMYIVSLSDTMLVAKERVPDGIYSNAPLEYNLFFYARRQ